VVAVVDPAIDRARAAINKKVTSDAASAYHDTQFFKTLHEFATNMAAVDRPQAIVVGSPPMFRGTLQANKDIEVQILKLFPSVAIFVEKPVTTGPQSEIGDLRQLANSIAEAKIVSSVGYVIKLSWVDAG
jgi:Oxidoreductase family, NAD-binding Rossmann fold